MERKSNQPRWNSYANYLRRTYGTRVHKVTVNAGFTCPNRDGSITVGGCTYCNNESFIPFYAPEFLPIVNQRDQGIAYSRSRFRANKFIVYFQPYSNTYANVQTLRKLYSTALEHPDVVGLCIGTRSDCVDEEKLNLLEELGDKTDITIEYGIESVFDKTLEWANRGHNYQSVLDAVEMTQGRGIKIGAHIILGFPTETRAEILSMAEEINKLKLDFLKIHNLHIVKHTALAVLYQHEPFETLEYGEYLDLVCGFIEKLDPEIILERLFGEAPLDLLIAPRWGKRGSRIVYDIEKRLEKLDTWQGKQIGFSPCWERSLNSIGTFA
jgi:hypothetical protein